MKRKGHRSSAVEAAKNLIRGSKSPYVALATVRGSVPLAELPSLARWAHSARRKGQPIFRGQFPSRPEEIFTQPALSRVPFSREVAWAIGMFKANSDRINRFLAAKGRFEWELICGSQQLAGDELDQVQHLAGVSLWSIESKLAFIQHTSGLEAQKKYALELRENRDANDLLSFITSYASHRNEPTTNIFRFRSLFNSAVDEWGEEVEDLRAYVKYRIADEIPDDEDTLSTVLRFESVSPLVDYYETFVRLTAHTVADSSSSAAAILGSAATQLSTEINDHRLRKIALLHTHQLTGIGELPLRSLQVSDALATGEQCQITDEGALFDVTSLAGCAEAIAYGLLQAPPREGRSIQSRLIRELTSVISKDEDMGDSVLSLLKSSFNYRHSDFAASLQDIVIRELANDPTAQRRTALLAFIYSPYLEPISLRHLPSDIQSAYGSELTKRYGLAPTIVATLSRAGLASESDLAAVRLSTKARAEALIQADIRAGDFEAALSHIRGVDAVPTDVGRREAARYEAHCLLQLDRIADLIELTVSRCLEDDGMVRALPIGECVDRMDKATRRANSGRLAAPIILDLYTKNFDDDASSLRNYAYEDFLFFYELERPSELRSSIDEFDRTQLIYYLSKICVPLVMQTSSVFRGTREVQDERSRVAALLSRIDPSGAREYEDEIRDIKRNQLIQRGVRHVEQSKIFIDIPGLKRWAEKHLKDSFARLMALRAVGIGADERNFVEALHESVQKKTQLAAEFLEIPKNESTDLLVKMIRLLFFECLMSQEHGLNCYLSMRIRHGTLSGQLRTPLEVQHLITQRVSEDGVYQPNLFWENQLSEIGTAMRARIVVRLATFSAQYDAFIDYITNELIRIRADDKPHGLFNVVITAVSLRILNSNISPDTTFDAFLDLCFEMFWGSVEEELRGVRAAIDRRLKPRVSELFLALESDIAAISQSERLPELERAIRTARTSSHQALDIVKDWFQLSQSLTTAPFSMEDLIDVSLQCVKSIHPEFNPTMQTSLVAMPPIGEGIGLITDIFIIIFDNVWRHSGISPGPQVSIELGITTQSQMRFRVESEVSIDHQTEDAVAKVARIRSLVAKGDYQQAVSSEGGTGFAKLRKLVGGDVGGGELDFGFDEVGNFFVEFELRKTEIPL